MALFGRNKDLSPQERSGSFKAAAAKLAALNGELPSLRQLLAEVTGKGPDSEAVTNLVHDFGNYGVPREFREDPLSWWHGKPKDQLVKVLNDTAVCVS